MGLVTSLQNLTSDASTVIETLITNFNSTAQLPSHYHNKPTLLAGYNAQLTLLTKSLRDGTSPLFEFLWAGSPGMGCVLQKPLSRGTVLINSTNPHPGLSPPLVDFNARSHPFDARAIVLAFKLLRRVMLHTSATTILGIEEVTPGSAVGDSEADIEKVMRESLVSPHNAHPCGTAGMAPRRLGGVVDEKLRVYGVKGLRVVDTSILPVIVAANLQATMYAVAEKAADIIKEGK
jgi:hypothetical protein